VIDPASRATKAYFGRRYTVSASHRLHVDALTTQENRAGYGKCNNPHGHGHNYVVEVMVGGPVDADTGMVMNLADLDRVVNERVVERFDHKNLNLDPAFERKVPTTENFSRIVFEILRDALPEGSLEHVRIEETENNFFECYGA
jgi:6-pyruvoyltetrahydropterin/6-carboxytetrahydropterin synthase